MKNILLIAIASCLLNTSCMTIMGLKKPIILVDAPSSAIVSRDGEILEVQDVTAFRDEQSSGNTNNVTLYKYP